MTSGGRRVALLGAIWAVVTGGALAVPGCYGRNCEGDVKFFGAQPGEGRMIDENTWESSPVDGRWLPYPRQRVYVLDIPELGGRTPQLVLPYISAAEDPLNQRANWTLAGGNLSELFGVRPNGLDVKNGTCADYNLRLVVVAAPFPPEPSADGGVATPVVDASVVDASGGDAGDGGP